MSNAKKRKRGDNNNLHAAKKQRRSNNATKELKEIIVFVEIERSTKQS